jgi:hypothetical protein
MNRIRPSRVVTVNTLIVTQLVLISGCGTSPSPSPYMKSRAKENPISITLPEIRATADTLTTTTTKLTDRIQAGEPVNVKIRISTEDPTLMPPGIAIQWLDDRPGPMSGATSLVTIDGTYGTATAEATAPSTPGEYKLEVFCQFDETPRRIAFDITISP